MAADSPRQGTAAPRGGSVTRNILVGLAALSAACTPPDLVVDDGVRVSSLRVGAGVDGRYLSMDVLATDAHGEPVACSDATVDVDVRLSFDGSTWHDVDASSVTTACGDAATPQVGLVLDNSGSQVEALEATREGAEVLAEGIVDLGGRLSLTRVSTTSKVLAPLTRDLDTLGTGLDDLYVVNGWTALYDGIRMGNETLGETLGQIDPVVWDDVESFCSGHDRMGLVVFSNGLENNSAGQSLRSDDDDGIDTTVDDVLGLTVGGVSTPIHTIALGRRVDTTHLRELSEATGGRTMQVPTYEQVPEAFALVSRWLETTHHVCAEIPVTECGAATVEVTWSHDDGVSPSSGTRTFDAHVPCPTEGPEGRTAAVLLTLNDPGIPRSTAATLVANLLSWVWTAPSPEVLLVRDDNHHDEDLDDVPYVMDLLTEAGAEVSYLAEPSQGLSPWDVAGYDVVWFTNPGWPMDDVASFDTLRHAVSHGKGVVMQGDDMSWSMGRSFPTTDLVHLEHHSNGTQTCGRHTDNRQGDRYAVTFTDDDHPVLAGLADVEVLYGNDIDHSSPVDDGSQVLAWAELEDGRRCDVQVPVVVVHDP